MLEATVPPFYSLSLNATTYDLGIGRGGRGADEDVAFYQDLARRSGGRVLELGCGTGRLAIPLAEAGLSVTGLDRSDAMLHVLRGKADRLPEEVSTRLRVVSGDMRRFDAGSTVDLVVVAFRSFQMLLTPADQRGCLDCVFAHLRPGGVLAIDVFDPLLDRCAPGADGGRIEEGVDPATGHRIRVEVRDRHNDPIAQVMTETWRFSRLDAAGNLLQSEEEQLAMRWTYRWEMRYLLERSGFMVDAEYSDYDGSPPAYGKEQVWVAHRPPA